MWEGLARSGAARLVMLVSALVIVFGVAFYAVARGTRR